MTGKTHNTADRAITFPWRRSGWTWRSSLWVALFAGALTGCGTRTSPLDEPMGYKTTSELKARLLEVAKYGDGGSSLGGIPESIQQLTQSEPEKGKKLLADFNRLNTAESKETRRKIAQEMADQLE